MMRYVVQKSKKKPELQGEWAGPVWGGVESAEVANFLPESSAHRPRTQVKLLYDKKAIYGIFHVDDKYVRSVRQGYLSEVYKDSCVEIFVKPAGAKGYFNFEFNAGGNLLCSYITDHRRTYTGAFVSCTRLPVEDGEKVRIHHSLPDVVLPEIRKEVEWTLEFAIPLEILARHAGPLEDPAGKEWRANFYKCGEDTSHPHWATWSPVPEKNFHLPDCFGTLEFAK